MYRTQTREYRISRSPLRTSTRSTRFPMRSFIRGISFITDGKTNTPRPWPSSRRRVRRYTCWPATRTTGQICATAFSASGYLAPDFDFIQYAIERYPVRLIALDTQSSGNKGDFCRERLRHLTDLVEAETAKPIAVFTHHPPFVVTEGPDQIHFENRQTMSRLRSALHRSGRVVAVFSGHVHRAASGDVAGIPAMVMPAIATTLRHGQYPAHLRSRPVYQVHRFDPIWGFTTETRIAGRTSVVHC